MAEDNQYGAMLTTNPYAGQQLVAELYDVASGQLTALAVCEEVINRLISTPNDTEEQKKRQSDIRDNVADIMINAQKVRNGIQKALTMAKIVLEKDAAVLADDLLAGEQVDPAIYLTNIEKLKAASSQLETLSVTAMSALEQNLRRYIQDANSGDALLKLAATIHDGTYHKMMKEAEDQLDAYIKEESDKLNAINESIAEEALWNLVIDQDADSLRHIKERRDNEQRQAQYWAERARNTPAVTTETRRVRLWFFTISEQTSQTQNKEYAELQRRKCEADQQVLQEEARQRKKEVSLQEATKKHTAAQEKTKSLNVEYQRWLPAHKDRVENVLKTIQSIAQQEQEKRASLDSAINQFGGAGTLHHVAALMDELTKLPIMIHQNVGNTQQFQNAFLEAISDVAHAENNFRNNKPARALPRLLGCAAPFKVITKELTSGWRLQHLPKIEK